MSPVGPLRRFVCAQQSGRFRREADINRQSFILCSAARSGPWGPLAFGWMNGFAPGQHFYNAGERGADLVHACLRRVTGGTVFGEKLLAGRAISGRKGRRKPSVIVATALSKFTRAVRVFERRSVFFPMVPPFLSSWSIPIGRAPNEKPRPADRGGEPVLGHSKALSVS
jgi:hypothetical protein